MGARTGILLQLRPAEIFCYGESAGGESEKERLDRHGICKEPLNPSRHLNAPPTIEALYGDLFLFFFQGR